jgi:lysozyme family protein
MADFLIAVAKTLQYEGGLVNESSDPGGLTNFGISHKSHPELTPTEIQSMTRSRAIGIYREKYWPGIYGEIHDQAVANTLFDFGVTSGVATAIKLLQTVLFHPGLLGSTSFGFLRERGSALDGQFGPNTVYVLNTGNQRSVRVDFAAARMQFYASLGRPEFLHSWFSRSIDALLE